MNLHIDHIVVSMQAVAHAHPLLYASTHPLPAEFLTRLPVVTEKREEDAKEAPPASGAQEVSNPVALFQ